MAVIFNCYPPDFLIRITILKNNNPDSSLKAIDDRGILLADGALVILRPKGHRFTERDVNSSIICGLSAIINDTHIVQNVDPAL